MDLAIIRSHDLPRKRLAPLIAESEREGHRHLARLRDEWLAGENRFDLPGEALFVAEIEDEIVGVCGLNRDPYRDSPAIGRVRRLYVAPAQRRRGVARELLRAVIRTATGIFEELVVRAEDPGADAFYRVMGFRRSGGRECSHRLEIAVDEGGPTVPTTPGGGR